MSQAHITNLERQTRAYFLKHDEFPSFVFVGIDVFFAMKQWARDHRVFYTTLTFDVNGKTYNGLKVEGATGIPVAMLVTSKVDPNFIGLVDQIPF